MIEYWFWLEIWAKINSMSSKFVLFHQICAISSNCPPVTCGSSTQRETDCGENWEFLHQISNNFQRKFLKSKWRCIGFKNMKKTCSVIQSFSFALYIRWKLSICFRQQLAVSFRSLWSWKWQGLGNFSLLKSICLKSHCPHLKIIFAVSSASGVENVGKAESESHFSSPPKTSVWCFKFFFPANFLSHWTHLYLLQLSVSGVENKGKPESDRDCVIFPS